MVIDEFAFDTPKTKDFLTAVGTLKLSEDKKPIKTLVIDSLDNSNLILSSRNVQKTKVTNSFGLNIYDIIYHEKLLISKAAVEELNRLLDPARESGKHAETVEAPAEEKPKAKRTAKPKADAAESKKPVAKKEVKPRAVKGKKQKAAGVEATNEEATDNG